MNDNVYYEIQEETSFTSEVTRFVRKKHYRSLPSQIRELAEELRSGRFSGDVFKRSDDPPYDVYKKRLPNPDTKTGKSGGYRVIYLAEHKHMIVAMLVIYNKKEIEALADAYIEGLVDGFVSALYEQAR